MTTYPFSTRAENLPKGAFWRRTGSDGWDFAAFRQKPDGSLTSKVENPHDPIRNEDRLAYGQPQYAQADGVVFAAWRNAPDNPPGEKHAGRTSVPKTIALSGNFLAVIGDDGKRYSYAHLAPGSIPASLCPFDDEFLPNASNKLAVPGIPHAKAIVGTLIPEGERPRIKRGQFIGRVGNAGNSSGPHIHNHMVDANGDKERFDVDRAWWANTNNLDVYNKYAGQVIGADDKHMAIHASPLLRRGHADAGAFGKLAMHFTRTRRVVTALTTSSGNLKLISWGMTPPEEIHRRGDVSAGPVNIVTICEPQSDVVVTAVRLTNGNLKLISWRVEADGDITRLADKDAGGVKDIAVVTVKTGLIVTAVRLADDRLKLIAWSVSTNGTIVRKGDAIAGRIRSVVATATAAIDDGLVTAVRLPDGRLKLIAWATSGNGNTITRKGDATTDAITDVAIVRRGAGGKFLLTAARGSNGKLRMQSWEVGQGGDLVKELATAHAGAISDVAIAGVKNPNRTAVVACRTSQDRIKLITWELSADGKDITRLAGALGGEASKISIAGTSDGARDFFVTACAKSNGELRLINWEANL